MGLFLEALAIVARFFQRFSFELDASHQVKSQAGVTLFPKTGIKIRVANWKPVLQKSNQSSADRPQATQ